MYSEKNIRRRMKGNLILGLIVVAIILLFKLGKLLINYSNYLYYQVVFAVKLQERGV